jgi:L-ascorbate metabolism protein UlaG (beta-lactamase superfamily)
MSRPRPHAVVLAIAAVALGAGLARATQVNGLAITFLANEGVMLSAGGKKVLIDGLFLKYKTDFALPADSTQAALQVARAPFDSVDLILVTHHHGDHFHPAPTAAHLRANPRATLLTSQQVIDSLGRRSVGIPRQRLVSRTTAPGTRRREVVNGISVELLGLPHGGGWRSRGIEHLAYMVEIGGRRVLHVGDVGGDEETFAPFRLDTARIDVALLPQWMLRSSDGRRVIDRWIRPKQIVAFHLSIADAANPTPIPGAVTFARSLETRRW